MNKQRSWSILAVFLLAMAFLPHQILATGNPPNEQKLVADDGATGDRFGQYVSVSGDTALIGAKGKTYVFVRDGDGALWHQQAKLPAGGSVSVFGDTAIIKDYVFVRTAKGTWKLQTQLRPANGADVKGFGESVSISENTALIGAWGDDDKGDSSGSAYVFVQAGDGIWKQQAKLTAADGAAKDSFGGSVSLSGDIAVIGASGGDSAYVFIRAGDGTWKQQAKLTAADEATKDSLSGNVSISGEMALIGAYSSESAYVFVRTADGTWKQQAKLTAEDKTVNSGFGGSVSISGKTALIGADWNESAYVFVQSGDGTWQQQTKLTLPTSRSGAADFGQSVSIFGDTVLIGAPNDNFKTLGVHSMLGAINSAGTGSAYIYSLPDK